MSDRSNRQFTRIHFTRKVRLNFYGTDYDPSRLKDLSLTGMFVLGHFNQKVGDECSVNLTQLGKTSLMFMSAKAKVAWVNDKGIAIQFVSMTYDSYMFLQTTLLYEADDPLFIGLELPDDCPFEIIDAVKPTTKKLNIFRELAIA